MKLGIYFTREEFERSNTAVRFGFKNQMNQAQLKNAEAICKNVLDPIRDHYDRPIKITSGFRSPEVNKLVGGSATSQHRFGQAADFEVIGHTVEEVYSDIKKGLIKGLDGKPLKYDQLIQEFNSWVHISYVPGRNRMQNLRAIRKNGVSKYLLDK